MDLNVVAIAQPTNIGDVISCLPMAAALKLHDPQTKVIFLGRPYTRLVIESCRHIDEYIDCAAVTANPALLSERNVDAFVNPFLSRELGIAARDAGVPIRVGNSRRLKTREWANRFVFQRSQYNSRHITDINLRYLLPLGIEVDPSLKNLSGMLGFELAVTLDGEIQQLLDPQKFNLLLHAKSNKSGREWPTAHFARLIELLPRDRFKIFLTGVAKERDEILASCPELLTRGSAIDLMGRLDLSQFLALIKSADGLVSSGTGPLHLAGALGIHALGLFPGRDRANARKWHPIGPKAEALSFRNSCWPLPGRCPKKYSGQACSCMINIEPEQVAARVQAWLN